MTKKRKRQPRLPRLDELSKWRVEALAMNGGFSDRFIAASIHAVTQEKVTKQMESQVRSYRLRHGKKLTDWRNGLTALALTHAKQALRPKKKKFRRAV